MSSELLNALESKVTSAVGTIEDLRTEIKVLKEERQLLESKLRELLQKIEAIDNINAASGSSNTVEHNTEQADSSFGRPGMAFGSPGEY